jgi:hypothetical protein
VADREEFVVAFTFFSSVSFSPFFSPLSLCLSAGSKEMENQNGIRILRLAHELIRPIGVSS